MCIVERTVSLETGVYHIRGQNWNNLELFILFQINKNKPIAETTRSFMKTPYIFQNKIF